MRIDILYFEGCPNYQPTVDRMQEALQESGIAAELTTVLVGSREEANAVGFLGSPTVRVDGLDIDSSARSSAEFGMTCRTYLEDGKCEGMPSKRMIGKAIEEGLANASADGARHQSSQSPLEPGSKKLDQSWWLMASSVVAAVVASLCCILPIAFALTGFTVIGAAAAFAEWRPYLLAITFGLLGIGFYFAYRPAKAECGPDGVCTMPAPQRSGRLMLWLATLATAVFAAFPYFSGPVASVLLSAGSTDRGVTASATTTFQHTVLTIEGMDCAACATAIERKLIAIPGVQEVKVSFDTGTAEVKYDPAKASLERLEKAVHDTGYRVRSKT